MSLEVGIKTKQNARLAVRQRADLFEANFRLTKLALLRASVTLKKKAIDHAVLLDNLHHLP